MATLQMMPQGSPEHEMTDPVIDFTFPNATANPDTDIDLDLDLDTADQNQTQPQQYEVIDVDVDLDDDFDSVMEDQDQDLIDPIVLQVEPEKDINMMDELEAQNVDADDEMNDAIIELLSEESISTDVNLPDVEAPTAEDIAWLEPNWDHQIDQAVLDEQTVLAVDVPTEPIVRLPEPEHVVLASTNPHELVHRLDSEPLVQISEEHHEVADAEATEAAAVAENSPVTQESAQSSIEEDLELAKMAMAVYEDQEMHLFEPSSASTMTSLLKNLELLHRGFDELIAAMQEALAHNLDESSELEIEVEDIGLVISREIPGCQSSTIAQVLSLHRRLQLQDQAEVIEPCYFVIRSRLNFSKRLRFLEEAAEAGLGLSEVYVGPSSDASELDEGGGQLEATTSPKVPRTTEPLELDEAAVLSSATDEESTAKRVQEVTCVEQPVDDHPPPSAELSATQYTSEQPDLVELDRSSQGPTKDGNVVQFDELDVQENEDRIDLRVEGTNHSVSSDAEQSVSTLQSLSDPSPENSRDGSESELSLDDPVGRSAADAIVLDEDDDEEEEADEEPVEADLADLIRTVHQLADEDGTPVDGDIQYGSNEDDTPELVLPVDQQPELSSGESSIHSIERKETSGEPEAQRDPRLTPVESTVPVPASLRPFSITLEDDSDDISYESDDEESTLPAAVLTPVTSQASISIKRARDEESEQLPSTETLSSTSSAKRAKSS